MTYWNYIAGIACLLLLALLVWKEVKRRNKTWLPARMVATVLAIAGLAGMALPFSYPKKIAVAGTRAAVLLTEGYNRDSLRLLLQDNGDLPVFTLTKGVGTSNFTFLPDVAFLKDKTKEFNTIHVLGNGLNEDELLSVRGLPLQFHTVQLKRGITAISWNQQLVSGGRVKVQGHFINDNRSPVSILLNGFDTHLDSLQIPAGAALNFELSTVPRHLDKAVYWLIVMAGKDTLEKEPVPIEVVAPQPVKVLLLAASLDFENKFIKNWLAQNGYPVMARTRISTDKFIKDYSNVSGAAITAISASWLNQFDVVIADAAELAAISRSELAAIQTAVSQQGMGLIVKGDSGISTGNFYGKNFPLFSQKSTVEQTIKIRYADDSTLTSQVIKTSQPVYIKPQPETQPLVRNDKAEIMVSSKLQGSGKVILTTLNNTYSWQLAGNEEAYSLFWAPLMNKAAKKHQQEEAFTVDTELPVTNEKATIQLQTIFAEPPQVLAANDKISMEQNYQLPYLWQGYYWPKQVGWVPVSTSHQTSWFYIFGNNDWQSVRLEKRKANGINYSNATSNQPAYNHSATRTIAAEIPKIYFFLLFLLPAAFLWFERKYKGG